MPWISQIIQKVIILFFSISGESSTIGQGSKRKSSLASVQKTLDSILEESEHDSSTNRKSSVSSLSSSFDEEEKDEIQEQKQEQDESEDEEDFDSDCSVVSAEICGENFAENMAKFQEMTEEIIEKEQDLILAQLIEMEFEPLIDKHNGIKSKELEHVTETLELIQVRILLIYSVPCWYLRQDRAI